MPQCALTGIRVWNQSRKSSAIAAKMRGVCDDADIQSFDRAEVMQRESNNQ